MISQEVRLINSVLQTIPSYGGFLTGIIINISFVIFLKGLLFFSSVSPFSFSLLHLSLQVQLSNQGLR